MKRSPVIRDETDASERTFKITNYCPVDIYPAIQTQAGTGAAFGGYQAAPGNTTSFEVSADWQGRIWARTNCTFNENGTAPGVSGGLNGTGEACLTGDCGGVLNCQGTV
jgi:Thaumatin family